MSEYTATVTWQRSPTEEFVDNKYSRGHTWIFDGGVSVPASASPQVVPLPYSVAENVDPEEAFVASISSCHMLFFIALAAKKRLVLDSYEDNALGIMQPDAQGNVSVTRVTLRPKAVFSGEKQPSTEQLEKMHYQAHQQCFIANSVKTEIVTEFIH